ncbi:MAG: hypothetical protein ACRDFX_00625 [Chloroflexota bacterium]
MRTSKRWIVVPAAAILALATCSGSAARADKDTLAGRWHLSFYGKCVNTPRNLSACIALQQPATFPVMGKSVTVLVVRGTGTYISDARGRYTVRFVTSITERVPGITSRVHCSDPAVLYTEFSGTCTERGSGHGHVALGGTGMKDFWQDETAGRWSGTGAPFAETSPTDTFNPVCAGTLNTAKFLGLFGFKHVPAGITARLVLTHHR